MTSVIVSCPLCGQKNRVSADVSRSFRCGSCKASLQHPNAAAMTIRASGHAPLVGLEVGDLTRNWEQYSMGQVYLLIDCSGSMSGQKLQQAKTGGQEYASTALLEGYAVGLISFGSEAHLLHRAQNDSVQIVRALSSIEIEGSTKLDAALELAIGELSDHEGNRVIVVVTDGIPDDRAGALAAGARAKRAGMLIVTIGTDDADHDFLRALASEPDLNVETTAPHLHDAISSATRFLPPSR